MKRLLKKLPVFAIAAGVIALVVYGYWPRPIGVDLALVTRGSLQVTVDDDGETRIREKYVVSSPLAGRLLRLQLHPGDLVAEAETEIAQILPLEPSLLDPREQAELEARVRAAEAAMQQAIAVNDGAIELAKLAEHQLDRAAVLIKTDSISQQDMDDVEHQVAVTKANVRAADFAIKVRSFELEQASAALQRLNAKSPELGSNTLRIIAPTSGKVLRVFHEDSGVVSAGTRLLEIGNVQDLEIVLDILSSEAARIQSGDQVFIDRWGGEHTLNGVVRLVEPAAFLKVSALGVEEKRVNVITDFKDPWELRRELGDGFRVEARIVIHETDSNSLKVASGSLFRHEGSWKVYRIRDDKVDLIEVEVGASNGLETEILGGINEGDCLVLFPTEQIRPGIRVSRRSAD